MDICVYHGLVATNRTAVSLLGFSYFTEGSPISLRGVRPDICVYHGLVATNRTAVSLRVLLFH